MKEEIPQHCLDERTSLVACPHCKGEVKELWHVRKEDGTNRKRIKMVAVICRKCGFDLHLGETAEGTHDHQGEGILINFL